MDLTNFLFSNILLKELDIKNKNYSYYIEALNELKKCNITQIEETEIRDIISNSTLTEIYIESMKKLRTDILYKSYIHGINHNIRVSIFALIISIYENVSIDDFKLILEAVKYHDIGRSNDGKDKNHGLISSQKLDFLVDKYNSDDLNDLKTIIICHSLDDEEFMKIATNNNIKDIKRCTKMYHILKDSDALDRVRLGNPIIKINLLRTSTSKRLIKYSYKLNYNYEKLMEN